MCRTAQKELVDIITLFDLLYFVYGRSVKDNGAVGKFLAQLVSEPCYLFGFGESLGCIEVAFQHSYSSPDTRDSLALKFLGIGMQSTLHQLGIGVVEHRPMHDIAVGNMVEGIAANLALAHQDDVVASVNLCLRTQFVQTT